MTPSIDRKRIETLRKLKSFRDEFHRWRDDSRPGSKFQKHGTQVRAARKTLGGFAVQICQVVRSTPKQDDQLAILAEMSKTTLALLGIWDFFRSKLEQRREPAFHETLELADELAWVCYQPAHARGIKEPPLVFLNSGTSPFILRRDTRFHAESLPRELVGSEMVCDATARLPFPVIGVPWYQVNHLPDAVVIGHEVGHAVESDLKLGDSVQAVIARAVAARHQAGERAPFWSNWRSELFADVYGCLATGPAFVGALRDFLAAPAQDITSECPQMSDYPPVAVRLRFNASVLHALGLDEEARSIWSDCQLSWNALPDSLQTYVDDAEVVAKELVTAKLPNLDDQPVTTLLSFDRNRQDSAMVLVQKARARIALGPIADLRTLFAAVRLAYEQDPRNYDRASDNKSVLVRLRDAMKALIKNDYRAGEPVRGKAEQNRRDKAYADAGGEWFRAIRRSMSGPG